MHTYTCINVCECVCMYMYVYHYICICIHTIIHEHTYIYAYAYIMIYIHMRRYGSICIDMYTYVLIHHNKHNRGIVVTPLKLPQKKTILETSSKPCHFFSALDDGMSKRLWGSD